ncbi:MAG: OmpH family outer membrane protein [Bacteroidales bacterium]|nr:OmpH family outer membrane protein [Bacteroidales bacterium]
MKRIALLLSIAALGVLAISCKAGNKAEEGANAEASEVKAGPEKGSIVYFNLDRVLEEYDMANDLRSVVETKVNSLSQEVNRRGTKLEKDIKAFQDKVDKGLLTRSTAEAQSATLQKKQQDFQQYAAQKQQEAAEEQQVMMNNIADAIASYLKEFNAEHQYALILTTQGGILPAPVAAGDPELDITDLLLEGLNAKYVKEKNASK